MSAQWLVVQHFITFQRQARKALAHIGVASRQPYPRAAGNGDHRRRMVFASALISADTVEVSTDPVIRIRPPAANSISTVPARSGKGLAQREQLSPASARLRPT